MKHLKIMLLAVMAVGMLAAVAAGTASAALPTVLFEGTEKVPVKLSSVTNTFETELQSASGAVLTGKGVLTVLNVTNLEDTSDGNYETLFTEVVKAGTTEKCNTTGDTPGEVLVPTNLDHLVYDHLTTETGGVLGVAVLFLVEPFFLIECSSGATKIKIKGSVLALISPVEKFTKAYSGTLLCKTKGGNGTPAETKYWNDSNEVESAELLNNPGSGFVKVCENVAKAIEFTANKMIEIMG